MSEWSWCDREMRKKCENYDCDCDHCTRNPSVYPDVQELEATDCFREIVEEEEKGEG